MSPSPENYHYHPSATTGENEIDINGKYFDCFIKYVEIHYYKKDIFNFDPNHTMVDGNAILFPPVWNSDDLVINSAEWDQDKLDLFLTEFV